MSKKVVVRKAGKKGKGVFALKDFKQGEVILRNDVTKKKRYSLKEMDKLIKEGKMSEEDTEHCDYIGYGKYVIDFSPLSYVNHSCDPKAYVEFKRLGKQKLIAIKQIKKGEELTYDYSIQAVDCIDGKNPRKMRCHCKSKECRKIVQGDFFKLSKKIQLQKLLFLPTWVKKRYHKRIKGLRSSK